MNAACDITVLNRSGRAIVCLFGEMELSAKEMIDDALERTQQGSADVIIDLSKVTYIDSICVNTLIRAHNRVPDGQLHLVGATGAVRRVFEITGLAELLLDESPSLTWQQITYHACGWRQWTTVERTQEGAPVAEISEDGPFATPGGSSARYRLDMEGQTAMYASLEDAMSAAKVFATGGWERRTRTTESRNN
jgi:anti-anti-sigma factor